ncbi:CPBP family intramembrane glutamic endopeptidase [Runella sp. SP2]|uniref:CPBP family intramembrane glutamic endopeptidase n=1 Tax=Runella sp. SP2 TaxID=2268026 RepID=UPI000F0946FE|nr:CPBP family intramembrane glutamic endopeptidase [Runella sp. SP2]AYQ32304.1 CPBP family intramembrane metalloprotease [Runella sp. SP2]
MKKIWNSLKEHVKADFDAKTYGFTAVFLVVIIAINYRINLERGIIDSYRGNSIRIFWYFLLYAFAYYGGVFIYTLCKKETSALRTPTFWLYSLFILGVLGLDGGFYAYNQWSRELFDGQIYIFAFHCLSNLFSVLTVVLPFLLFYYFIEKQPSYFYGLRPQWFVVKPYLLLVVLMVPLISWASFQPDFLRSYPSYKGSNADEFFGVAPWATTLFYEVCYGFDFCITEWLFRGFLTIGMARFLGRGVIIPMVVCYASLHFGKPLGETIGSIFGGYILGVLALQTRSIWGGIIVHVGVAWLMDLAAWLQKAAIF